MAKIPMQSIRITRAEGPTDLCGKPVEVSSWEAASRELAKIAETAPDSGGYDKTDFLVTFADGGQYEGRADVQRGHTAGYDLREHMRAFLAWQLKADGYARQGEAESARKFLDTYELDGPALPRLTAPSYCPKCGKADAPQFRPNSEIIHTVVLGWECRACRQERLASVREEKEKRVFIGEKYEATKTLRMAELSKLIKADIKAALPGFKFSVRTRDHHAIDISVTAAPVGFVVKRPEPHEFLAGWMTDEARTVHDRIEAIANAYNRDASDIQSDYFDVHFYLSVGFSSEVRNPTAAPVPHGEVPHGVGGIWCQHCGGAYPCSVHPPKASPPTAPLRAPKSAQSEFMAYLGVDNE